MVLTNVTTEQPVLPLFLFINVLISVLKKNLLLISLEEVSDLKNIRMHN